MRGADNFGGRRLDFGRLREVVHIESLNSVAKLSRDAIAGRRPVGLSRLAE
jgi:hypothetical protein